MSPASDLQGNHQPTDIERLVDKAGRLVEFFCNAWPVIEPGTPLEWEPHLDAVCLHLAAVSLRLIQNLLIEIPPGCTKSIACNVIWPAFEWTEQPWLRWLYAANEDKLVIRDAVACRRLVESDWYKGTYGHVFTMTSDQNVKGWYENSCRGYRTSTTVGGSVTGKKGDILVVDDPNDAKKVKSPAHRLAVKDWWRNAFYNRVNNAKTGRRVVIGQRTDPDDLQALIRKSGRFTVLTLPEEYIPERHCVTSIGWSDWRTQPGELLRPNRFGPDQVVEARATLGSLGYGAQHLMNPTDPEGSHFKPTWFGFFAWNESLDVLHFPDGTAIVRGDCVIFLMVDPATGKGATGDFTAIGTFALTPSGRLCVLDMVNDRIPVQELPRTVSRLVKQWGPEFVGVEANGFQVTVANAIKAETGLPIKEMLPNLGEGSGKSKFVRAQRAIIMAEAGDIWVPEEKWTQDFLDELAAFTGEEGGLDNRTDTLAYAAHIGEQLREREDTGPIVVGRGRNVFAHSFDDDN